MGVSENGGSFPPKSWILIGFSMIFTIRFGVPLFLETPICIYIYQGGGNSKIFLFITPKIGEDEPIWRVAHFLKGVGEKAPTRECFRMRFFF